MASILASVTISAVTKHLTLELGNFLLGEGLDILDVESGTSSPDSLECSCLGLLPELDFLEEGVSLKKVDLALEQPDRGCLLSEISDCLRLFGSIELFGSGASLLQKRPGIMWNEVPVGCGLTGSGSLLDLLGGSRFISRGESDLDHIAYL